MKLAWSSLAKAELVELRRHSLKQWGRSVTSHYVDEIRDTAKRLAVNPRLARHLRSDFRVSRVRSHYLIIQFDEAAHRIVVVRLLHTSMDLERHLGAGEPA